MEGVSARDLQDRLRGAVKMADDLESASASSRIELLRRLVARITVGAKQLEIVLRMAPMWGGDATPDESTTIVVPVQLKRCGLAVRLIDRGPKEELARGPDPRLIALLVKAQRWFALLTSGQRPSVLAIAQEHGTANADVTRAIYLAFLAPDLVRRIIRSEQPIELGTKKLLAMEPLPMDWGQQRRLLGFG